MMKKELEKRAQDEGWVIDPKDPNRPKNIRKS